jgi:hypothetical protein
VATCRGWVQNVGPLLTAPMRLAGAGFGPRFCFVVYVAATKIEAAKPPSFPTSAAVSFLHPIECGMLPVLHFDPVL